MCEEWTDGSISQEFAEKKFYDTSISIQFDTTGEVSTNPTSGALNLIPQDDTESGRDGRQCVLEHISIKGFFLYAPGVQTTPTAITYLYLVLDKQANGAYPVITDIFENSTLSTAHINVANERRFEILEEWVYNWNPLVYNSSTENYNNLTEAFIYDSELVIELEFSGATGVIEEVKSNNLILVYGANIFSDDEVTLTATCRLHFRG